MHVFDIKFKFNAHRLFIVEMVSKCCFTYSIGVALRVCSFLGTLLPSPAAHCRLVSEGGTLNPNQPIIASVPDIFTTFDTEHGCGDLIFSGHTLFFLIAVLVTLSYLRVRYVQRAGQLLLLCVCLPLFVAATVATSRHYTVDVLVALFVTTMLWLQSHHWVTFDIDECKEHTSDRDTLHLIAFHQQV